ncbi:MAG TPA: hypothetical protein VL501_03390 [Pyrinomonadaceae bacterium]|nr:hypothetical protein [Pyrinomonadaceae bacterium]
MLAHGLRSVFALAFICCVGVLAAAQPAATHLTHKLLEMPDLDGAYCVVSVDEARIGGTIWSAGDTADWHSITELAALLRSSAGKNYHDRCAAAGYVLRARNDSTLAQMISAVKVVREIPGATGAIEFGNFYMRIPLPPAKAAKPDDRLLLLGLNPELQVTINGERYTTPDYLIGRLQEILDRRERFYLRRYRSDEVDRTVHVFAPDSIAFKELTKALTPVVEKTRPVPLVLDIDQTPQK